MVKRRPFMISISSRKQTSLYSGWEVRMRLACAFSCSEEVAVSTGGARTS